MARNKKVFGVTNDLPVQNVSNAGAGHEYRTLSKEDIKPSPFNEGMDMDRVEEYAESMKVNGILEPITVYDLGDGTYEILTGHQRFEAWCNILGNATIKAVVLPYEDDAIKRFRSHTEANTLTRNLDLRYWLSRINMAKKLLHENGFDGSRAEEIEKVSEMLNGISKAQLYRYESFEKLIPQLQAFETKRWLSAMTLYAAVGLDEEQQRRLAEKVEEKYDAWAASKEADTTNFEITREEFVNMVNAIKKGEDTQKAAKKRPSYRESVAVAGKPFKKILKKIKTEEDVETVRAEIEAIKKELDAIAEKIAAK